MQIGNPIWCATGLLSAGLFASVLLIDVDSITANRAVAKFSNSASAAPTAVVPEGWRRTSEGWEHTSTWTHRFANASINQWIQLQRQREPAWIRFGLAKLQSIPPLMIAVLQISAIAVIINIAQSHRKQLTV